MRVCDVSFFRWNSLGYIPGVLFSYCSCVFLPNNGAFFVNYLITSALIGTALELCRFPELVSYAGNMACARNEGEKRLARKVRKNSSSWESKVETFFSTENHVAGKQPTFREAASDDASLDIASDWLKIFFSQSEAIARSEQWHVISMEFLRSFLGCHFAGKAMAGDIAKCRLFS